MSRPVLSICVRCRPHDRDRTAGPAHGDELAEKVRSLRRQLKLKEVFKVEEVNCLSLCDTPCAVQLEGKKHPTMARIGVRNDDAERLVHAMRAYAVLAPGQELPERMLPGEHAD